MLKLNNISKSFPGVKALSDLSVEFLPGEIHALLGENGAGKSTLMKIICGVYQADSGEVFLDGKKLRLKGYSDAVNAHISIVNQEITLIPNSSIAENIVLDKMDKFCKYGFMDWKSVNETAKIYMERVGLDMPPTTPVRHLSAAHKQLIQIAKALSSNAKVLLLDEPTSSLTQFEADILFDILRKLRQEGVIMIYVSHKLEEVQMLADRVTVLRDGKLIGTDTIDKMDRDTIVKMMIGRNSSFVYRGRLDAEQNPVALEVENLSSDIHGIVNLNFSLKKGEILGLYGLVGSGRTETIRTVLGIDPKTDGSIKLYGQPVKTKTFYATLQKHKMGYVSENRKEEGLFLEHSVGRNICINSLQDLYYSKLLPFIKIKNEQKRAEEYIERLEIKTPKVETKAGSLSGGNQQKISIAKWLSVGCDVIVIDEPTVGVDIGAKEYIHQLIWDLAAKENKAVIVISSDMNEIVSLARRILIFKDKKIVNELKGEEFFEQPGEIICKEIGKYFI